MNYRPEVLLRLEVPSVSDAKKTEVVTPNVVSYKWSRNNHLHADELTITTGWEEAGCDPRYLRNSTCEFYLWDSLRQTKETEKQFLRFAGICVKATRKLSDNDSSVTLTFHDYTSMFLNMKPYPTAGMPEYTETLEEIWKKICDHTGYKNPADGKFYSSVEKLRDKLEVSPGVKARNKLSEITTERFAKVAKPTVPFGANAWQVWQWCCGAMGYISYIDGDTCQLMTTTEHYEIGKTPGFVYGENILEFEEEADSTYSGKGILLKSYDPITGVPLEAMYPPPGDERINMTRSQARKLAKNGNVNLNDLSKDYDEFSFFTIQNQKALDLRAEQAYYEYSRQQLEGRLRTTEMALRTRDGSTFDLLDIRANDSITVVIDPGITNFETEAEAYNYLREVSQYPDGLAKIMSQNFGAKELATPLFHVTTLEVTGDADRFEIDIKYHNLVHKRS